MIWTMTLNPSVDYFVKLGELQVGGLNRIDAGNTVPGGKGINVSRVLTRLAIKTRSLGFAGGFTGRFIVERLTEEGIETDFTEIQGQTRINVKVKADQETEINGQAPEITDQALDDLFGKLEQLQKDDWLVISGSAPDQLGNDIYKKMIQAVRARGIRTVLDTSGAALKAGLEESPWLIKPNDEELAEFFGSEAKTTEALLEHAKTLRNTYEIPHIIVSMGSRGAIYVGSECYMAEAPKGELKNSIGAGDSMVAGFLAAKSEGKETKEAFAAGVAAGSATAFSYGLCQKDEMEELLRGIIIKTFE